MPELPAGVELTPVSSSNVAAAGYDPVTRTMYLSFKNGKAYAYPATAPGKWASFRAAPSKGKWVWAHLRGYGKFDSPFVEL